MEMKYSPAYICDHVQNYIDNNNTTKIAMASRLNMSRSAFYEKLEGKRHWLVEEVIDLADIIGCEVTELLMPLRT